MPPAAIAQELFYGEDVEGLVDLPIKEIIDRVKGAFPSAVEKAGLIVGPVGEGSFEMTWSWQHVRFECHDLADDECQQFTTLMRQFDCSLFEQTNIA